MERGGGGCLKNIGRRGGGGWRPTTKLWLVWKHFVNDYNNRTFNPCFLNFSYFVVISLQKDLCNKSAKSEKLRKYWPFLKRRITYIYRRVTTHFSGHFSSKIKAFFSIFKNGKERISTPPSLDARLNIIAINKTLKFCFIYILRNVSLCSFFKQWIMLRFGYDSLNTRFFIWTL